MDTELLETIESEEVTKCSTGTCNIKPEVLTVKKGDYVVFYRGKTVRTAKVVTKGGVKLGLDVLGMESNTTLPASTELVPVTVFMTKEVAEGLAAL
jgi:hypothetical protein